MSGAQSSCMHEYVFTAEYEQGADPLTDVFIAHPQLVGTALRVSVSSAGLWRVDRYSGPEPALERLLDVVTDPAVCNECLGEHPACTVRGEHEVVQDDAERRLVYSYADEGRDCHSVPYAAGRTLGDGVLFDAHRRGNVYEWRVLVPGEAGAGDLFDRLQDGLPEGVTVSLTEAGSPSGPRGLRADPVGLSPDQREAIETAVALGYYGTPREASLREVADALDLPKSTLRYRLRRAERRLTDAVFGDTGRLRPAAD